MSAEPGAPAPTLRHAVELVPLPQVDLIDEPYATDPVAVVVDRGGDDGSVLVTGLEKLGWTVRRSVLGDPLDEARLAEDLGGRVDLCLAVLDNDDDWDRNVGRLGETILVAKHAHAALSEAARSGRAGFVTVTHLDGGLGHRGARSQAESLLGGVGGVVKTLASETPELFCRAVDVDPGLVGEDFVAAVLDELHDAAVDVLEVGVDDAFDRWAVVPGRYRLGTAEAEPVGEALPAVALDDDVLVVTGGGRGVTALCVRALAEHCSAEFLLLGRTELAGEPLWARDVAEADLKAAAIGHLKADGGRPTPREVERLYRDQLAQREIRSTVDAVVESGARARYIAVDVTDPAAVREVLEPHRDRITGLVHGAGVLADAYLPEKTAEEIERVFTPKLGGLRAVLDAVDEESLQHLVLFTSVAGLLGNAGQADYAAANEALCRFAASWKRERPEQHVTAIDWGAWDGGMVTPGLRELFHSRGVALLEPEVGARAFVEQFDPRRADQVCVLVGQDKSLSEDTEVSAPAFVSHRDITDLADDPVIQAHRIGEHPVLPATFGLGWMVNALEGAHPGRQVVEVRDFQVLKGILFDGSDLGGLHVVTEPSGEGAVQAWVRGESAAALPTSHYVGTFRLAPEPDAAPVVAGHGDYALGNGPEDGLDIYREATQFHGPRLQGMRRILKRTDSELVLECRIADSRVGAGAFAGVLHSPVLADVLLQGPPVLGKWLLGQACLPLAIGRVQYFAPLPDDEPFVLVLDEIRQAAASATVTATAFDAAGRVLQRFADVAVVATPDMSAKFTAAVQQWQAGEDR